MKLFLDGEVHTPPYAERGMVILLCETRYLQHGESASPVAFPDLAAFTRWNARQTPQKHDLTDFSGTHSAYFVVWEQMLTSGEVPGGDPCPRGRPRYFFPGNNTVLDLEPMKPLGCHL